MVPSLQGHRVASYPKTLLSAVLDSSVLSFLGLLTPGKWPLFQGDLFEFVLLRQHIIDIYIDIYIYIYIIHHIIDKVGLGVHPGSISFGWGTVAENRWGGAPVRLQKRCQL